MSTAASAASASTTAAPSTQEAPFAKWTPSDDLLLMKYIEKRPESFADIVRNVKFAQRYTADELKQRWNALLYDPEISYEAARSIMVLTTQQVKRVPWTDDEDCVLRDAVRQHGSVNNLSFSQLLDKNRDVFHPSRNVKSVETHFYRMKHKGEFDAILGYAVSQQQQSSSSAAAAETGPFVESVTDVEQDVMAQGSKRKQIRREKGAEIVTGSGDGTGSTKKAAASSKSDAGSNGSAAAPKRSGGKRAQRALGKKALELEREHALDSHEATHDQQEAQLTGKKRKRDEAGEGSGDQSSSEDVQQVAGSGSAVFAALQGATVNLPVTKPNASIGRHNKNMPVDVDLSVATTSEESLLKVSRLQAELRLAMQQVVRPYTITATGAPVLADQQEVPGRLTAMQRAFWEPKFFIKNVGKKKMTVNGALLATDQEVEVRHLDRVVFPGDLSFIFSAHLPQVQAWASQQPRTAPAPTQLPVQPLPGSASAEVAPSALGGAP